VGWNIRLFQQAEAAKPLHELFERRQRQRRVEACLDAVLDLWHRVGSIELFQQEAFNLAKTKNAPADRLFDHNAHHPAGGLLADDKISSQSRSRGTLALKLGIYNGGSHETIDYELPIISEQYDL